MNTQQLPENEWHECQPGEIGQAVSVLRNQKRNRSIATVASLTVAALVLLMLGGLAARTFLTPAPSPSNAYYAGIGCAEVYGLLPELRRGQLPAAKSTQVRAHLEKCPKCRAAYERLQNASLNRQPAPAASVALLGR